MPTDTPARLHRLLGRRRFGRILVLKPSAVGDVVHALPAVARLRHRFPDARIDWLINEEIAPLLAGHPAIDGWVTFPRRAFRGLVPRAGGPGDLVRMLGRLREGRYDLAVDLQGRVRTAVLALWSGAAVRIGPAHTREWTAFAYTHAVVGAEGRRHAVGRNLEIVAAAGAVAGPDGGPGDAPQGWGLPVDAGAEGRVAAILAEAGGQGGRPAVIAPGTMWETKHWTAEGFAGVAAGLRAAGMAVVLAGSPGEADLCRRIAERAAELATGLAPGAPGIGRLPLMPLMPAVPAGSAGTPAPLVIAAGRTGLAEMAALLRRAAVCICNDSGALHIAVAAGVPTVTVFGPTDPELTGPWRMPGAAPVEVARAAGLECSPCFLRTRKQCPHEHRCMTGVTAEGVLAAVGRVLSGHGGNRAAPAERSGFGS